MQKRIALIVGSVILAAIAMVMVKVYLDQQKRNITEITRRDLIKRQESQASVFVANRDIPKGTAINAGMLEQRVIPRDFVQPQAVTSPERVEGMVAIAPISPGEQVTLSKLSWPQQNKGGSASLSSITPVGKRAISISVDNIASLVGMIKPGDYVDVVGVIPIPAAGPGGQQVIQTTVLPLFQNVMVLAVGQDVAGATPEEASRYKQPAANAAPLITLALSPQETNFIAFVQEQGKVRLILRSPADSNVVSVPPASWEGLFQYLNLMPQAKEGDSDKNSPVLQAPEKPREVVIYRGLKKEFMPVTK